MIGPPYESSFVQLFLPLLQNEAIAGTVSLRTEEERKCVKEFIGNFSFYETFVFL
jgi:negative elongation factor C/D